jgi:hypothetical protein
MPVVSSSSSQETQTVLTAVEKTEKQIDVVANALSDVASKTEKQIDVVANVLSDVASKTEKQIEDIVDSLRKTDAKRKRQAKNVAKVTLGGVSLSILVFCLVSQSVGLLCAVLTSALPSFVNLVDD